MFRELGRKIVNLYQEDLAIKKDAKNFIFWGGLLGAFCIWAVHDVPKMLPHGHVSPIQPPTTRLRSVPTQHLSHLAPTRSNLLRL
jgi:hypothetical protein